MRKSHLIIPSAPKDRAKPAKAEGKTQFAPDLVAWYREIHRKLPWRAEPGQTQDPYRVWLAEIMLQQTTVVTVKDYYLKFLRLWPTVQTLAATHEDDVLREWAGLGYYSRARNLHACARVIVRDYKGRFPATAKELIKLPGIGPYTAAAVAALAFAERVAPVDGNVERVMSRIYALSDPPAKIKPQIKFLAQGALDGAPSVFPGDYAQALMDLGATVCTPKSPKCMLCPISKHCRALARGNPESYPAPIPKAVKPQRQGLVYLHLNKKGQVWVEKRPDKGLLGGMAAFPTSEWGLAVPVLPVAKDLRHIGRIRHSFTHFDLELQVIVVDSSNGTASKNGKWVALDEIPVTGLPKVFLKAYDFYTGTQKEDKK